MGAPRGHPAYNVNGEGGRPKKYTQEFIESEAEAFELWMKDDKGIYFKEFALERGYSPQRLPEFAEINKRFSEALSFAHQWQEVKLVKGGLTSEFNAGFCKFVMGNACGWVDRQETKIRGDSENPISFLLTEVDGNSKDLVDYDEEP